MESDKERLQKWLPGYVVVSLFDSKDMCVPELEASGNRRLKLCAVRNLSRRILQKHCTAEGQKS